MAPDNSNFRDASTCSRYRSLCLGARFATTGSGKLSEQRAREEESHREP
jgi:hypothetical protein